MSARNSSRRRAAFALASAAMLVASSFTISQERLDRDGFAPSRDRGPPPPGYGRPYDWPTEATVKRMGFAFIDGQYLESPYEIRYSDSQLTINGRVLTCIPPPRGYGGRGGGPSRGPDSSWRFMVNDLSGSLNNGSIVMSFENQPYVVLDGNTELDLLTSLVQTEMRSLKQVSVREQLPEKFDRSVWDKWIENFDPPDALKQRAGLWIANYTTMQQQANSEIRAARWMERLAYPLSVASMVLIVLSIGHLLGGRPHAGESAAGTDLSPKMIRALEWSLFFTTAFSSIDLIWTILAASNNQMRELNPIGSHLIKDPRHLAGFKIGITFSCLALLWLLRRHKRAQIAAWWVCLILTLVTIRWLTFSSLFQ